MAGLNVAIIGGSIGGSILEQLFFKAFGSIGTSLFYYQIESLSFRAKLETGSLDELDTDLLGSKFAGNLLNELETGLLNELETGSLDELDTVALDELATI